MNCATHIETAATAYCRACGKPLCGECQKLSGGVVYCAEHAPAAPPAYEPSQPAAQPGASSPGWAFVLGLLIPGVGAIYNGQYAKGLVHALLFGLLISLMSNDSLGGFEPLAGFIMAAFVFYMGFEAYHTARKRAAGEPVDEFSSLVDVRAGSNASAIALIVIGGVFLLDTLDLLRLRELLRFWPVLLIALGVSMLYSRLTGDSQDREAGHERQ